MESPKLYNGGGDPPFIVTRVSSSWREGQPQLAERRQRRVRGLLTSSFRMGPSMGALSTKEGRVLSSFTRSRTVPIFNHRNGQTAPYVALPCTFGVISSLRGVAAKGPSFGRLTRRAWRDPPALTRGERPPLMRCTPDNASDASPRGPLTAGTGDPGTRSPDSYMLCLLGSDKY